jgi:hypothetical protein
MRESASLLREQEIITSGSSTRFFWVGGLLDA